MKLCPLHLSLSYVPHCLLCAGAAINTSYAFTCLRDGIPTTDPDIELRRALFADIFSRLQQIGVTQSSLQLAWDFTVATRDAVTGRMVFMRDDALQRVKGRCALLLMHTCVCARFKVQIKQSTNPFFFLLLLVCRRHFVQSVVSGQ